MNVRKLKQELQRIACAVMQAPENRRARVLEDEVKKLPPDAQEAAYALWTTIDHVNTKSQLSMENRVCLSSGVAFIAVLLLLAILFPRPEPFQMFVFRVVLAIGAAAVGATLPGFFRIEARWVGFTARAGGALGLFLLVYMVNPPELMERLDAKQQVGHAQP